MWTFHHHHITSSNIMKRHIGVQKNYKVELQNKNDQSPIVNKTDPISRLVYPKFKTNVTSKILYQHSDREKKLKSSPLSRFLKVLWASIEQSEIFLYGDEMNGSGNGLLSQGWIKLSDYRDVKFDYSKAWKYSALDLADKWFWIGSQKFEICQFLWIFAKVVMDCFLRALRLQRFGNLITARPRDMWPLGAQTLQINDFELDLKNLRYANFRGCLLKW